MDDERRASMFNAGTKSVVAYEHLLRASKIYHEYHNIDPKTAPIWTLFGDIERALEADSTISIAYVYRGDVYNHFMGDMNNPLFSGFEPPAELAKMSAAELINLREENIATALRFEEDPMYKTRHGIILSAHLNDFTKAGTLIRQLPEDYKSSPILNSAFISEFVYPVRGADYALKLLNTDLEIDPYNIQLRIKKFNILLHQEKKSEAREELRQILSINSQNAWVWEVQMLYALFDQDKKRTDSLLNVKTNEGEISSYQQFWKLALENDLEIDQVEDSLMTYYPEDFHFYHANVFWQRGDREMANQIMLEAKPETWAGSFFWDVSTYFSYYIPFELDEIPELKKGIIEMGIDPGFFKPMPIFRKE